MVIVLVSEIASVLEFFITFVFMGKVPVTEHGDTLYPDNVCTTGSGTINVGGTNEASQISKIKLDRICSEQI